MFTSIMEQKGETGTEGNKSNTQHSNLCTNAIRKPAVFGFMLRDWMMKWQCRAYTVYKKAEHP